MMDVIYDLLDIYTVALFGLAEAMQVFVIWATITALVSLGVIIFVRKFWDE